MKLFYKPFYSQAGNSAKQFDKEKKKKSDLIPLRFLNRRPTNQTKKCTPNGCILHQNGNIFIYIYIKIFNQNLTFILTFSSKVKYKKQSPNILIAKNIVYHRNLCCCRTPHIFVLYPVL